MESTVTSKGQVTLPKRLRDRLDIHEGAKVVFLEQADGSIRMLVRRNNLKAIAGILKPRKGMNASIEDLKEATRQGAVDAYTKSIK